MDTMKSRLPRPGARIAQPRVPLTRDLTNLTNIVQGLFILNSFLTS